MLDNVDRIIWGGIYTAPNEFAHLINNELRIINASREPIVVYAEKNLPT